MSLTHPRSPCPPGAAAQRAGSTRRRAPGSATASPPGAAARCVITAGLCARGFLAFGAFLRRERGGGGGVVHVDFRCTHRPSSSQRRRLFFCSPRCLSAPPFAPLSLAAATIAAPHRCLPPPPRRPLLSQLPSSATPPSRAATPPTRSAGPRSAGRPTPPCESETHRGTVRGHC